ncbi:MAG: hypothetical protein ACREU5_12700 [Burkholderiales bacterium]
MTHDERARAWWLRAHGMIMATDDPKVASLAREFAAAVEPYARALQNCRNVLGLGPHVDEATVRAVAADVAAVLESSESNGVQAPLTRPPGTGKP